ncbi:MAG: hypothetical protein EXS55_03955 [Candidatus Magasanikbacteria bacterium]|nr:hypothetical protein [Candidatus Magasanikbacteria bacterium]
MRNGKVYHKTSNLSSMPIPYLSRPPHRRVYGELGRKPVQRVRFSRWPWQKIMKAAVALAGMGFVFLVVLFVWASQGLPDPNKLNDRHVAESTKIYDRTGEHLLYEVYQNQKRTVVNLQNMSPWIAKATIAIEDKYFYEHKGVRLISIARAGVNNLIGRRTGSGGASTLTQQLIKNTIVGKQHSLLRKIKEAILALRLERAYSKDEILQLYLNEIPYGSINYGVESASQAYFHKSATDISLPEAATLAALIKAPSFYLNNPDSLKARRNTVLALMMEQGYITEEQKIDGQTTPLSLFRATGILGAPHFVLYIKQLLANQFGENLADTGGLRVITTLDYDKQVMAEKIVKEQGDRFAKDANANNEALVALDPATAQVLVMVGSRDFTKDDIDGKFNIVTQGRLQPGSSFKPFVYAAAFAKGFTPETVLYDVNTNFDLREGAKPYSPKNYDGKEHGLVTMRSALQGSLNIPAVKTMYLVGEKPTIEFAKRFGYTTFTGDYGLTLVLGGGEVNLLEHANAYGTLANNGVYHEPVSILKVSTPTNETLYEWKASEGTEAVSSTLAALITNVLADNGARAYVFGAKNNLTLPDRAVAAKTGTTQNNWDAWTVGYVPSLVAGVWVGNTPKHLPMKAGGNTLAGVIWNRFMRAALASTTPEDFSIPPGNDAEKPVLRGAVGGIRLPINRTTGRIANSSTPDSLIDYQIFLPSHDILHYVNKDDPRGEASTFPADDPQYQNWENALQDWVTRQQAAGNPVTLQDPPTEIDNPQSNELAPTLAVIMPTPNQIITSRQIHAEVKTAAPRGVARVVYSIDEKLIATSEQFPFSIDFVVDTLSPGIHALKVVAQDDMGNSTAQIVSFNLQVEPLPADFDWLDKSPLNLIADAWPRVMTVLPTRWDATKDVQIYLVSNKGEKAIFNFNHAEDKLVNNQLVFTWKHNPGAGSYTLRAILTDEAGRTVEKKLEIIVK